MISDLASLQTVLLNSDCKSSASFQSDSFKTMQRLRAFLAVSDVLTWHPFQ